MNYSTRKLLQLVIYNDLRKLKKYVNDNNIITINNNKYHNKNKKRKDILIEAIKKKTSLDVIKYIVDKWYDDLNFTILFYYECYGDILTLHESPLTISLINNNLEVADYLIKHWADINCCNEEEIINAINYRNSKFIVLNTNLYLTEFLIDNLITKGHKFFFNDYFKYKRYTKDTVMKFLYLYKNKTPVSIENFGNLINIQTIDDLYTKSINLFFSKLNSKNFEEYYSFIKILFDNDNRTLDKKYLYLYKELRHISRGRIDFCSNIDIETYIQNLRKISTDNFDKIFVNILKNVFNHQEKEANLVKQLNAINNNTDNNIEINNNNINNNNHKIYNSILTDLKNYLRENKLRLTAVIQDEYNNQNILIYDEILNWALLNLNKPIFDYLVEEVGVSLHDCNILSVMLDNKNKEEYKNDFLKYLVEREVNINYKNEKGNTAIAIAFITGKMEFAKYLIKHRAIIYGEYQGETPLTHAIINNDRERIEYFIVNGANANERNRKGNPLGYMIVYNREWEEIKYLVEHGAYINEADYYNDDYEDDNVREFEPLLWYIYSKYHSLEYIKYLVERGADVYVKDNVRGSCFIKEIDYEFKFEIIKYFVEHGIGLSKLNCLYEDSAYSILDYAIDKGDFYEIKFLIENRVEAKYYKNKNELSILLLFIDIDNNAIEKIKYYNNNKYKINMNENFRNEYNALGISLTKGNTSMIDYLIKEGANINEALFQGKHIPYTPNR
ncbi:hypothetical protein PIROE2DRAFT_68997 [Piromyces sp. E2]|nr:hypothetical protein PIROE2DRAFT_68997 [Piromyces sp. E2]|eukprot:OUM66077.1 hypothetical protein PIROE2DRAFT_68997 [Piromyces sp. E2]